MKTCMLKLKEDNDETIGYKWKSIGWASNFDHPLQIFKINFYQEIHHSIHVYPVHKKSSTGDILDHWRVIESEKIFNIYMKFIFQRSLFLTTQIDSRDLFTI